MPPRDYRLAGGYLAQFHVGEGIRRDVTPPNPKVKDTARRAHDSIGPRQLRRFVCFGIDFLQLKIKTVGMRRRQLSCLYLADRNAFEFMLAQHLQRAAVERTRCRLLTFVLGGSPRIFRSAERSTLRRSAAPCHHPYRPVNRRSAYFVPPPWLRQQRDLSLRLPKARSRPSVPVSANGSNRRSSHQRACASRDTGS